MAVVLTKKDLLDAAELEERIRNAQALAGALVEVTAVSADDPASIESVRERLHSKASGSGSAVSRFAGDSDFGFDSENDDDEAITHSVERNGADTVTQSPDHDEAATVTILIGCSGAGKSTLVNRLLGDEVRATSAVREGDGKGRHKTVSREMLEVPFGASAGKTDHDGDSNADHNGGDSGLPAYIVDMPGIRGLGLWDSKEGIEQAFPDVVELAAECRFRDCKHLNEPGCAVLAAADAGDLDMLRVESYRSMLAEIAETEERRERATWKNR